MRLRGETNFKDCGESRRKGQVQQVAGRWSRNLGFPTKVVSGCWISAKAACGTLQGRVEFLLKSHSRMAIPRRRSRAPQVSGYDLNINCETSLLLKPDYFLHTVE